MPLACFVLMVMIKPFVPCRYRPTVSLPFVLRELLFGAEEDGEAFLQRCGVNLTPDGLEIACKASVVDASGLDADAPNSLL